MWRIAMLLVVAGIQVGGDLVRGPAGWSSRVLGVPRLRLRGGVAGSDSVGGILGPAYALGDGECSGSDSAGEEAASVDEHLPDTASVLALGREVIDASGHAGDVDAGVLHTQLLEASMRLAQGGSPGDALGQASAARVHTEQGNAAAPVQADQAAHGVGAEEAASPTQGAGGGGGLEGVEIVGDGGGGLLLLGRTAGAVLSKELQLAGDARGGAEVESAGSTEGVEVGDGKGGLSGIKTLVLREEGQKAPFCVRLAGVGDEHVVVVLSDGVVLAAGSNEFGQLGIGHMCGGPAGAAVRLGMAARHASQHKCADDAHTRWVRVQLDAMCGRRAVRVVCGALHSFVLLESGQILGWGCNAQGQLGAGKRKVVLVPTEVAMPAEAWPRMCVDVSSGLAHTLAVTSSGVLLASGSNDMGQLGMPVSLATQARMRQGHRASGWGGADIDDETEEAIWERLRQGGAGLRDGGVQGAGAVRSVDVSTGGVELDAEGPGSALDAGCDGDRLGLLRRLMQVENGVRYPGLNVLEAKGEDGHDDHYHEFTVVPFFRGGGRRVRAARCGNDFSVAWVEEAGGAHALYVFGSNLCGQLGLGAGHPSVAIPRALSLLGPFQALSCGGFHTLVRDVEGRLWGWGLNLHSQLSLATYAPICWTPSPAGHGAEQLAGSEAAPAAAARTEATTTATAGVGDAGLIACGQEWSVLMREDSSVVVLGGRPIDFEALVSGGAGAMSAKDFNVWAAPRHVTACRRVLGVCAAGSMAGLILQPETRSDASDSPGDAPQSG